MTSLLKLHHTNLLNCNILFINKSIHISSEYSNQNNEIPLKDYIRNGEFLWHTFSTALIKKIKLIKKNKSND